MFWEHSGLGRLNLRYWPHPAPRAAALRVSDVRLAHGGRAQAGEPHARAALSGGRSLFTWVLGVEHQLNLLDDRLENSLLRDRLLFCWAVKAAT